MLDSVPYNLFTTILWCYVRPPSKPNPDESARMWFCGDLQDIVQADLLLQPILADTAKIITDTVLVNLCLCMPRMILCRQWSLQMYRCWVVYARSWRVIALPIMLLFSCLAAIIALLVENYSKVAPSIFPTIFTSCHLANNIYGTCMIPYHTAQ